MASNLNPLKHLNTLYQVGVVGDLTDSELLQRLLRGQDEASEAIFSALVERHGPMVLQVCRKVLGNHHDAQDAFQATFLVLARKARSIRKTDSVASWLHGVALRVSAKSKGDLERRKGCESRAGQSKEFMYEQPETWPELHEEIARLPGRYREPVVLCYLEGLSTEAAALRLGCPKGTLLSQLSRARERLRGQLIRRGLVLPSVLIASSQTSETLAALPLALAETTVRMSLGFAGHRANEVALTSATTVALAQGVLSAMTLSKLKILGAALLACVIALGGVRTLAFQFDGSGETDTSEGRVVPPPSTERKPPTDIEIADAATRQKRIAKLQEELQIIEDKLKELGVDPKPARDNGVGKKADGPDAVGGATSPTQFQVGGLWLIVSPRGDKLVAYDGQSSHAVRLAPPDSPPLEVEPVQPLENSLGDRRVFALALKGPRITRIAAADTRTGRWYAHDLKEPATGELRPLFVAGGASLYHVGRSLYYFNGQTGNPHWIVVELPAGVTAKPTRDKVGRIHVEGGGHFFTLNLKTGKWDDLDLNAILNSAKEQEAGDAKPEKP